MKSYTQAAWSIMRPAVMTSQFAVARPRMTVISPIDSRSIHRMARRKQSLFEDIVEVTAKLPWWLGLILAAVAYIGLHAVASTRVPAATDLKHFGDSAVKQIYTSIAMLLQYVLPVAFVLGSIVSVFARRKRANLFTRATASTDALNGMSWRDFELLVGEYFRRRGFSVQERGGAGPDGGVDLVVSAGSDRYVVQCKKWKARQVGVATVRELYGVIGATGAAGGFVVTSGTFTQEARKFVEGLEIELLAADFLLSEVRKDRAAEQPIDQGAAANAVTACPECGKTMVLRTSRKGSHAGGQFWGCSAYPKCRGTRAIA